MSNPTNEKLKQLLPCPFCGAIPIEYDSDYIVTHADDCYITHVTGNRTEHWLVRKRIVKWQVRSKNT